MLEDDKMKAESERKRTGGEGKGKRAGSTCRKRFARRRETERRKMGKVESEGKVEWSDGRTNLVVVGGGKESGRHWGGKEGRYGYGTSSGGLANYASMCKFERFRDEQQ